MVRYSRWIMLFLAAGIFVESAAGFSMLGPYAPWQTAQLGYNPGGTDIGGPMNLGEEYRWNVRTVSYGFDKSFLDYFGQRGVQEVNKAIAIMNRLPPASRMSEDLLEFPQDSRQINFQAFALGLLDLKSTTLGYLMEEVGLASPERYVWTLFSRFTTTAPATNYFVIMRNFDPVTLHPSPYVNGVLYTYNIQEFDDPTFSDAVEVQVDPLAFGFNSVANAADGYITPASIFVGAFFTGLTRDDVGGVRYIYNRKNVNVENPLADVTPALGVSSPWGPGGPVPGIPNVLVTTALRPGIDKLVFRRANYYGTFLPVTNRYVDLYLDVTNNSVVSQRVQRVLVQPDLIFSASDNLPTDANSGAPFLTSRTDTAAWINNGALNNTPGGGPGNGPGVVAPSVVITFSTVGPFLLNIDPGFLPGQANVAGFFGGWAAFDGTTNAPFIFPQGTSIHELEQRIFSLGL